MKKENKIIKKILIAALSVVGAFLIFLIIIGIGVYKYNWQNNFTNRVVNFFPYPAATVSCKIITYSDWQKRIKQYESNKNFYLTEQEVDLKSLDLPDDKKIKEKALEDLIKEAILNNLAKHYKVELTSEEIDEAYHDLILAKIKNGETAAEKSLAEIYGLSIAEFKEQVIKNYLLRKKLTDIMIKDKNNDLDKLALKEAEEITQKIKNGEDFETLARSYSDDGSALAGGDIGYIGHGEMLSFYDSIAWKTPVGEVSDIVKTPTDYQPAGYYFIKVEDKRDNNGEEEIKIRHIFIETNLDKLLDKELQSAKIMRWVKNF